jgi:hypothetical protein
MLPLHSATPTITFLQSILRRQQACKSLEYVRLTENRDILSGSVKKIQQMLLVLFKAYDIQSRTCALPFSVQLVHGFYRMAD